MSWKRFSDGEKYPVECKSPYCCHECDYRNECYNVCNSLGCLNCSKYGRTKEAEKHYCKTHDGGWDD